MNNLNLVKEILEKKGKYYIVFVGDSITSCEWVHPNWRDIVLYVVQQELYDLIEDWKIPSWGVRGFNFGFDGATTRDIANKLPDILQVKPDFVIGLMGGNDPVLGVSVNECKENIEKIIDKVLSVESDIAWYTSIPAGNDKKNNEYEPYAIETMKLDDRKGLQKVNLFEMYKKFPLERFFTFKSEENLVEGIKVGEPDLQHPNQLGNAYIAKIVLEESFGIMFDPEKYIKDDLRGEKLPGY